MRRVNRGGGGGRHEATERPSILRCAVYTRKSSEDGLEQSFNSLDAQREACLAYIVSQRHEGWKPLSTRYDDGGFSGGSLHRPGLQRLLADVQAHRLDLILIYKVDRLTRSLADFAKLIEVFDAHRVSFVSITQHFNTSTSIGRLTLNMLLSFAQFEREVTGERIRDKIAASKRRGMWMGGPPPLGYDVRERTLVINPAEAETVRHIFRTYLELGSVRLLAQRLHDEGARSKLHAPADGGSRGGKPLVRGVLYLMLQNRLYRGEIAHKGEVYPGQHEAIVDEPLWQAVQTQLMQHRVEGASRSKAVMPSLLAGLAYDQAGNRLVPTHATRGGKRYRYYVSAGLVTGSRSEAPDGVRLPAADLEHGVVERVKRLLVDRATLFGCLQSVEPDISRLESASTRAEALAGRCATAGQAELAIILRQLVSRVDVEQQQVRIAIDPARLLSSLSSAVPNTAATCDDATSRGPLGSANDPVVLTVALQRRRAGRDTRLLVNAPDARAADPTLLRLLGRAHRLKATLLSSPDASLLDVAQAEGITRSYLTRLVRLAYLTPDITGAILDGRQPPHLTAARLIRLTNLPLDWTEQSRLFQLT